MSIVAVFLGDCTKGSKRCLSILVVGGHDVIRNGRECRRKMRQAWQP